MKNTSTITAAILRKDILSLLPLLVLTVLVNVLDVLVGRLDVLSNLRLLMPYAWFFSTAILVFSVFQLDPPVSLTDDWLCRPVPRGSLLLAKLALLVAVLYVSRVLTTLGVDLYLGYSLAESLPEALLPQMPYAVLLLPVIMMAAIVTGSVIQGIGALLGLFILLWAISEPINSTAGPLRPNNAEAMVDNGMMWMLLTATKLTLCLLACACFWVVYRHRSILFGRILLVASTVAALLVSFSPVWLLSWGTVSGLQDRVAVQEGVNREKLSERLSLHHDGSCFPATSMAALVNDTAYTSARQVLGMKPWNEDFVQNVGSGGLTFITRVQPLGVPRHWRVQTAFVQANFVDAASGARVALRPVEYITDRSTGPASRSLTHQWLLPEPELNRLVQGGQPRLELDYSLALLRPRSHELAADGIRRKLPDIGYCGATRDNLNNRIVVDCFSAGARPALISAGLLDIPSSRVDSWPADYAPGLVQSLSGRRVELIVASPSLVGKPVVEVTGWEFAGLFNERVSSDGILGADAASCPLPVSGQPPALQTSNWKDDSPHTQSFIAVDSGVQLEVLDWGGSGTPVLLLPGLGATAHTFDRLAPLLSQDHRVFALTRRGMGSSSHPDFGYDTATLSRDVVRVLDALQIDKAVLVGSSIAGEELSYLGAEHPERVAGLVYLDAAYDRSQPATDEEDDFPPLPPRPSPRPEDLRSYGNLQQWMQRTGTDAVPEGELLATYNISNRYLAGVPAIEPRLLDAVEAAIERPRYEDIRVPALALYATRDSAEHFMRPWYDAGDPLLLRQLGAIAARTSQLQRTNIEQFRNGVADAEVVELRGASHVIHVSNEAEVLAQIRRFIAARASPPQ